MFGAYLFALIQFVKILIDRIHDLKLLKIREFEKTVENYRCVSFHLTPRLGPDPRQKKSTNHSKDQKRRPHSGGGWERAVETELFEGGDGSHEDEPEADGVAHSCCLPFAVKAESKRCGKQSDNERKDERGPLAVICHLEALLFDLRL